MSTVPHTSNNVHIECTAHTKNPICNIGQLPRVSGEDPKRIRVDSVVETCVCLFFVCFFFEINVITALVVRM